MSTHINFFSHPWYQVYVFAVDNVIIVSGCGHIAWQRQGMLWSWNDNRLASTVEFEFELHGILKYMLSIRKFA